MSLRERLTADLLVLLIAAPALAVTPSDKYSAMPASTGLAWKPVSFNSTRDGAALSGWWFEGQAEQPVIVVNPQPTEIDAVADLVISGAAGTVLPALLD